VCRQRPARGASHHLVDVAVEVAVERVRRAGRQRAADQYHGHQPQLAQRTDAPRAAGREQHRRDGGDQQQFDDPRLGERQVRPGHG
jgi:hypothetical protein